MVEITLQLITSHETVFQNVCNSGVRTSCSYSFACIGANVPPVLAGVVGLWELFSGTWDTACLACRGTLPHEGLRGSPAEGQSGGSPVLVTL